MEYTMAKENYSFYEKLMQTSAEQSFDTEINLPDYCSDVQKILKCLVTANINSCRTTGDRITAEGEMVIRVIYVGEKGNIECYEQSLPFSKFAEIRDIEGELEGSVSAGIEYVNCRAVSQRRISVSGNMSLIFRVGKIKNIPLPSGTDSDHIQTKCECINTDMEVSCCEKIFEMGETVSVGESQPPVASFVRAGACAVVDSVKAVENKLLIKGEMKVFALYCADDEKKELVRFTHTMPISQILQIEGIDESCICDANVAVCGVCLSPKADSNGKNTLVEISIKAEASVRAYKNTDCNIVSDCYSTSYELKCEYKNMEFLSHLTTYKETKQVRATVDLSSPNVSQICDSFCLKTEGNLSEKDGVTVGNGNVLVGIIFKTAEGEYGYCERSVDFSFDYPEKHKDDSFIPTPMLSSGETECATVGGDKAEIKADISIFMPVCKAVTKRVCTCIEPDEEKPKKKNEIALTVYFCDGGENIWDIARRYNTTVQKIKEENELTEEIIAEKTMLMIPGSN